VPQIALHLEVGVKAPGQPVPLQLAAELPLQGGLGQIGDVRRHPGDGQALLRPGPMQGVVAAPPVGVSHDRLAADLVEGDVLGAVPGGGGDADSAEQPLGIGGRPLQHLHPAHGAADHGLKGLDAHGLDQHGLGADHVGDGDDREGKAPGLAGRRVEAGRAGAAHAAADDVGADDEVTRRIQRPAGADQPCPPARLAGDRVFPGHVLIQRQGVTDEDGVGPVGVERAETAPGDLQSVNAGAGVEDKRLRGRERPGSAILLDRPCLGREGHARPWTVAGRRCQPAPSCEAAARLIQG
jgi:hypothetical protein